MRRSLVRLSKTVAAAVLIAVTPGLTVLETVEHARSANQPHHPYGSHFEGYGARSHSDHCFAGRTFGYDRLVLFPDPPKTTLPDRAPECCASTPVISSEDRPTNQSRAPPVLRA
jgi:hypothetical protein